MNEKRKLYNQYYYQKTRAKKKTFTSYEDYLQKLKDLQVKVGGPTGGIIPSG